MNRAGSVSVGGGAAPSPLSGFSHQGATGTFVPQRPNSRSGTGSSSGFAAGKLGATNRAGSTGRGEGIGFSAASGITSPQQQQQQQQQAPPPSQQSLVSYVSFIRRSSATIHREAKDLNRLRRDSGGFGGTGLAGGQGYPFITGGPSLGPSPSAAAGNGGGGAINASILPQLRVSADDDNNLTSFLPALLSPNTSSSLLPPRSNTSAAVGTVSAVAGGRSVSATPLLGGKARGVGSASATFLTETRHSNQSPSGRLAHRSGASPTPAGSVSRTPSRGAGAAHSSSSSTVLPLAPFTKQRSSSSPSGTSRRGMSALAAHQNAVDSQVLSVLFNGRDGNGGGNSNSSYGARRKRRGEEGYDSLDDDSDDGGVPRRGPSKSPTACDTKSKPPKEDPMDAAMRLLGELVTALKDTERDNASAAMGHGRFGADSSGDEGGGASGGGGPSPAKGRDPMAFAKGNKAGARSKLGPSHTVNFGPDHDVEERFRELLAIEGIDAEQFLDDDGVSAPSPASPAGQKRVVVASNNSSSNNNGNSRNLSDLLDLLSKSTLKEEHAVVYQKINARYEKDEADRKERLRKQAEALAAEATSGNSTTQSLLKRAGPSGPANAFALLNEIHRRENTGDSGKQRPTLVERFRSANDKTQGGIGSDGGSTMRDGTLTAKMILVRKLDLLRRDRPLRLKFFEHVKALQRQMRAEQDELSANDPTLTALMNATATSPAAASGASRTSSTTAGKPIGGSGNIAARNVLSAQLMTQQSLEERRRQQAQQRDERLAAARDRYHEHQGQRRARFVHLVERARGIGYAYDTGLTDPNAQYRYGSEGNDIAAYWMQFMVLIESRRAFAEMAGAIIAKREVSEALARRKAKEDRSAKTVQRWWKRTLNLRRAAQNVSSILVVVKYLQAIPKIQCRFRIAMRTLINRVIKLQRHFRAMFAFRRLRYEHARRTIALVAKQEVARTDKDVIVIGKERRKLELQLNAAIKGRKQHFQDAIKQHNDRIMEKMKQKEYLIALSEGSVEELATLVMGPKERAFKLRIAEYAAQAHLKFLAATNPSRVIEMQMGYKPTAGLFSFKEQSTIRRVYAMSIARPYSSLVVSTADAQGIIEERGYALGQKDFVAATLTSN